MPEKSNHRLKLIRSASKLFQHQGYSASGVSQIISESGTPRGSFYYYFPEGKEQLADETVRLTGEEIRTMLEGGFAGAKTFADGVDQVASMIADWFEKSGWQAGCPITTVHLEKTPQNTVLTKASQHVFTSWVETVQKIARQYGHDKQSSELAQALIIGLEGAWVLSRASKSKAPFYVAAKMVKMLLK